MDINALQNYYRIQTPTSFGRSARPSTEAVGAESDRLRSDKIDISSQGSFKAQLAAYSKNYAAQNGSSASSERIAQLKQQYSGDACPISGMDIAAAVMKCTLGVSNVSR